MTTANNKLVEALDNINSELTYYSITQTKDAVGEDGKKGSDGYAVTNKENDVVEHTTTILPGAIFQARHLDDMLVSLIQAADPEKNDDGVVSLESVVDEDPVLN